MGLWLWNLYIQESYFYSIYLFYSDMCFFIDGVDCIKLQDLEKQRFWSDLYTLERP